MIKKIFLTLAAVSLLLPSAMPNQVQARSGSWSQLQATAAWVYDDYKVERLDFSKTIYGGPMSMGDAVIVAKASGQCAYVSNCERYDLYAFKNGMTMFLGNVPRDVVNEQTFLSNGEDLVYTNSSENGTRWSVIDLDLETGDENTLIDDVFIAGVQDMEVFKDNEIYYFNPTLNWNGHNGFVNAVVYQYDKTSNEVEMVTNHYQQQNDDVQDISNGKILSKMTFESGYKQLWIYDTTSDPRTMVAVPGTWTPSNENILGAHFRADGTVEFFDMYQRYIYDGTETVAQGDYLSWYRSHEEALQVVNGRMAWLDPQDGLHVSGADVDLDLGTIGFPDIYKLTDNEIYYSSGLEGKKYDFATGKTTTYSFVVTDALEDVVVGEDYNGDIWYQNNVTDRLIKVGYGSDAVVSDDMHVYWRGTDNNLYEATMSLHAMTGTSEISAVKVSGDSRVYLVLGSAAYWMPNEKIYFTWFNSWNDVKTVSATTLNSYTNGGTASYAPGTRLQLTGDSKVYMVGADGKLHWLTTQLIAYNIYGQDWNQGIVEINMADTTQLLFGTSVMDESDVQNI